mgnify:CR=1 FL=1
MQATYSNLRSRLMMGLLLIAVTLISTTNSWANFYSVQLQDSITEASLDSFIVKNEVAQKYKDTQTKEIQQLDNTIYMKSNQIYQIRFPNKDIKVRVKTLGTTTF